MRIGGRSFGVRWRWLALVSLIWIVAIYAIWTQRFMPDARSMFDQARSQCSLFTRSDAYAYADCLHFEFEAVNRERSGVAAFATLLAILPVALLWVVVLAGRFLRECRKADPTS